MKPYYGMITYENGITTNWLRFAENEETAIKIVKSQVVHVAKCISFGNYFEFQEKLMSLLFIE